MKTLLTQYKCILLLGLLGLVVYNVGAQGLIKGRILGTGDLGAPFATVRLLSAADSSMVKGVITDENGNYSLQEVPTGLFVLEVSSMGFEKYFTGSFSFDLSESPKEMPLVELHESAVALDEVLVKGQRPVMERKSDRYVMDVTASSFQTDNLMNIFMALPFVQVGSGGIKVNGRSGILIVLDNVQMPGATMNTILETMTGDEIDNIEFITNPSSRYPANINSVIKITTKKSKNYGLTGSVRTNFSQGIRTRWSGGTSLLYRQEKWFADLNLNYSSNDYFLDRNGYRILDVDGETRVFNETYESSVIWNTLSLRGRVEYTVTAGHTVGIQSNFSNRDVPDKSKNVKNVGFSDRVHGVADSLLVTEGIRYGNNRTESYSAYYSGQLDTLGKRLDVVMTYTPIGSRSVDEMFYQNILSPGGELLNRLLVVKNTNISDAKIYVGQLDLELPYRSGWSINMGTKLTYSTNKTRPYQEVLQDGQFVIEEEFSFKNDFEERIWAGYGSVGRVFGETTVNAGLRVEYSSMQARDLVNGTVPVDRKFTNLFPSLLVSRQLSDDLLLSFNYRETIDRPGFSVLTPYRIYQDDYTILEGNPELLPQYNRSFALNGVIKDNLFIEVEYKQQRDVYTHLPELVGNVMIFKMRNFDLDYYGLTLNYSYEFTDWWSGSVYGMGALYNGEMSQEYFKDFDIPTSFFHNVGWSNKFSLPLGLKLDVGVNYIGPYQYGLLKVPASQNTWVALGGSLFDKQLDYSLSVRDIFRRVYGGGEFTSFNTFQQRLIDYFDSRRVQLGLVYRFGKNTIKGANTKKLGNEDVVNRAN